MRRSKTKAIAHRIAYLALAGGLVTMRISDAWPHQTVSGIVYPPICCNSAATHATGDCAPIEDRYVSEQADGYHVNLPVGAHPKLKTKGYNAVIPLGENAALKARIAHLTGRDMLLKIRRVFRLSESQGRMFALLLARGEVSWGVLIDEVYDDHRAEELEDPQNCIRSVMKHVRAKVRRHRIQFETIYEFGYRMPDECRSVARRLLEARA